MGYTALGVLLIIVGYLYLLTKDSLSKAESKIKEKDAIIDQHEESRRKYFQEQSDAYLKEKEDLAFVIKNMVILTQSKGLYSQYDPDELCQIIKDNDYIIGVKSIQDIDFKHFEKTIKAALYADKGYLQAWQRDSTQLFRMDQYGKHIPLTDEELNKLKNHDFDFIFDSLKLF